MHHAPIAVLVPGGNGINLPGLDVGQQPLPFRPVLAVGRGAVVVLVVPRDDPALDLTQRRSVLALAVHTLAFVLWGAGDAQVTTGSDLLFRLVCHTQSVLHRYGNACGNN